MIDVTGIDLVKLAQKVYELSVPQGMGFIHFTPKPLPEETAKEFLKIGEQDSRCALDMDYVNGRACKFRVRRNGDKLELPDSWYDHTDEQYAQLLDAFGIKHEPFGEHGCACNCVKCQVKQRKVL